MSIFSKKKSAAATAADKIEKEDKKQIKSTYIEAVKNNNKDKTEEKKNIRELRDEDVKAKKSKSEKGEVKTKAGFSGAYRVIERPLVTEKASGLGALNKYAFVVSGRANKISVGLAVEQIYGVKPGKVNVVNMKGKKVRSRRVAGRRKDWKKAIVTLPAGKTINIYEGV